ncbi:T cell receptor beta chain MC.7.G5 isoform X2 [Ctenopharyngodon idella]|uniref:T cell receptor beta chain MC.7.G5 isoform X2 n=1 Tax=Ctenopharyngodon idella TaxID=7959 RepID=UPI00222F847C|nr:T cell receptor beta chain MC.7.G5 isoform X2 [Ctenopharyngodon idella]
MISSIAEVLTVAWNHCEQSQPAYFGNGTKLTVLGSYAEISTENEINVTIIKPSEKESCKKTVTLVCVAKDFYPDHVNITWMVGNKERVEGVATDPHANKDNTTKKFTISSRLKVPKKEWNNAKKEFKCKLMFYNGTTYLEVYNKVYGTAESGYTREDYVKSSQIIKLSYGVFIAKSALYGLVIFVYVLRKGSGK